MTSHDVERARLLECAGELRLCGFGDADILPAIAPLDEAQLDVTVLGQTKAGKTALVNALAGVPGMLPVDVNPWTAVVTSVHLGLSRADGVAAEFEFYDEEGWSRLVAGAGRAAALALRSGGEADLEVLRAQLAALQDRARARLGRNFELLLGGRHRLTEIDPQKLARYVVFGEEDAGAAATRAPGGGVAAAAPAAARAADAGRYAELTRRAGLWLPDAGWGLPAILRDTPGVNDPLLVREQATLEALDEADVGLLTLNASQALATADLALMRALSALGAGRAVIFINRIDDLTSPAEALPQIVSALRETLAAAGLDGQAPVLWGSAAWSAAAASAQDEAAAEAALPPHSRAALADWRRAHPGIGLAEASGVPALRETLSRIAAEGRGRRNLQAAAGALGNLAAARLAAMNAPLSMPPEDRADALAPLFERKAAALDAVIEGATGPAFARMRGAVLEHADIQAARMREAVREGRTGPIDADLQGLRRALAAQYEDVAARIELALRAQFERLAEDVARLSLEGAGAGAVPLRLAPPQPPRARPPAALARSLSVDAGGGWWSGLFRRETRAERRAEEMRRLIEEEMTPVLDELKAARLGRYAAEARAAQRRFFLSCIEALLPPGDAPRRDPALEARLRAALETAQRIAAAPHAPRRAAS